MSAFPRTAMLARLAAFAAGLALLAVLALAPVLSPSGARAQGPLPNCRYDDILTTPRGYGDWAITLVDTILRVPKGYVPPDLVSTSLAGIGGGGKVRAVMIDDLRAMTEAAAQAGAGIGVQSAYRSFESQKSVFDSWVAALGYQRALEVSARPGHSEHQLGLALDVRSASGGSPFTGTFGSSPAGKWMKAHAWEYGFVMSYPRGSMDVTCYDFEPWHFRYVGRELAALIRASGLTPREYLWANYTTTIVPPAPPKPTRAPARTAAPTAVPAPTPTATTSPTVAPSTHTPAPTPSDSPAPTPLPPSAGPTPAPSATAPPDDPESMARLASVVAAGAAGALGLLALGAWVLLRRGRCGAGL
jgi:D-alanyl-D-alanine carboxypeptidase